MMETQALSTAAVPPGDEVIRIKGLDKSFGKNAVLRKFDLGLHGGESVAVLGKSGSGKSVLIKCIIGLLAPDAGTVEVYGQSIPDLDHQELDRIRVKVGFLFQSNALYDSMTVRQNLEFPLRRHWIETTKAQTDALVMEALDHVGLAGSVDSMPAELSGGMRKRIALARTLILKPGIILYDEPTTGLDPITAREISRLMLEVSKKYNTSSLVISHDIACIKTVATRIVMLIDGRCYADGTYDELKRSRDNRVQQFFEGYA